MPVNHSTTRALASSVGLLKESSTALTRWVRRTGRAPRITPGGKNWSQTDRTMFESAHALSPLEDLSPLREARRRGRAPQARFYGADPTLTTGEAFAEQKRRRLQMDSPLYRRLFPGRADRQAAQGALHDLAPPKYRRDL